MLKPHQLCPALKGNFIKYLFIIVQAFHFNFLARVSAKNCLRNHLGISFTNGSLVKHKKAVQ